MQYNASETNTWYGQTYGTKNALIDLGYDELGIRYNSMDKPPVYSRPWPDLMAREAEAAVFLGYTEQTWHQCQTETPCITRLETMEARMMSWGLPNLGWNQLNSKYAGIVARLEELGWSERSWYEYEPPAPMQLAWKELPYAQRIAAQLLGYREDVWMKCPMAPCLDRFRYIRDKFASVRWADLKEAEKRAWMLLGHSPELWKNGRNPASMQMRWEELSAEQRRQAEFLGHSQGTWQGCNDAWVAPPEYSNGTAVKLDENRIVRGRMTIQRPFTEISGNVYGQQVADLPTSFI